MHTYRLTLIAVLIFLGVFPLYFVGPKILEAIRISQNLVETQEPRTCPRMAALVIVDPEAQMAATQLVTVLQALAIQPVVTTPHDAMDTLEDLSKTSPGGMALFTMGWTAGETLRHTPTTPIRVRIALGPVLDLHTTYTLAAPKMSASQQKMVTQKLKHVFPAEDRSLLYAGAAQNPRRLSRDGLALWRLIHSTDPALGDLLISNLSQTTRQHLQAMGLQRPQNFEQSTALSDSILMFDSEGLLDDKAVDQARSLFNQGPAVRSLPLSHIISGQEFTLSTRQWIGLMLTLYTVLSARDATAVAHAKMNVDPCL